jgi:hypothetical protein
MEEQGGNFDISEFLHFNSSGTVDERLPGQNFQVRRISDY